MLPKNTNLLAKPIDDLQLYLRTARILKGHKIETIGQLSSASESNTLPEILSREARVEIANVLASRGL